MPKLTKPNQTHLLAEIGSLVQFGNRHFRHAKRTNAHIKKARRAKDKQAVQYFTGIKDRHSLAGDRAYQEAARKAQQLDELTGNSVELTADPKLMDAAGWHHPLPFHAHMEAYRRIGGNLCQARYHLRLAEKLRVIYRQRKHPRRREALAAAQEHEAHAKAHNATIDNYEKKARADSIGALDARSAEQILDERRRRIDTVHTTFKLTGDPDYTKPDLPGAECDAH